MPNLTEDIVVSLIAALSHTGDGEAALREIDDVLDRLAELTAASARPIVHAAIERARASADSDDSSWLHDGEARPLRRLIGLTTSEEAEPVRLPDDIDEELARDFLAQHDQTLESLERAALEFEAGSLAEGGIEAVYRTVHTLKGDASLLGLGDIEHRTHTLEDEITAGTDRLDRELFAFVDWLAPWLGALKSLAHGQPAALVRPGDDAGEAGPPKQRAAQSKTSDGVPEMIRVDQVRLDRLVDAIGELVIAESMVRASTSASKSADDSQQFSLLDKITRELQDTAMSLRMVPLRSTFHRMTRLARDVAKKLGKPIQFVTTGADSELDKTMVDALADPLMHMVRNAVDHGMESVDDRRAAGKPEQGTIELRAYCEGGGVYIELEDDGGGMNRDAILAKAVERGVVPPGVDLPDSEVFKLVFEPGFSTAQVISEVSGRGVGLDVVKQSIEAMRGSIEIRSELGKGTTFVLRMPLTLAIIDGMLVRVHSQRFVIPTLDIVRIVQRSETEGTKVFGRGEMIEIGEDMVPLYRVADLLDLGACDDGDPAEFALDGREDGDENQAVVVVEVGQRKAALAVDEILGKQQTVIKSLGPVLAGSQGFAGGAMMPDGRISLILDLNGLLARVRRTALAAAAVGT